MSYKGFFPGMICLGKQYAEHELFEEIDILPCEAGLHFCESPFEVLSHYPLINAEGDLNEYAIVWPKSKPLYIDGKKYCARALYVDKRLTYRELIAEAFKFNTRDAPKKMWDRACISSSTYNTHIASTIPGSRIAISASYGTVFADGKHDHIVVSGDNCSVLSTGDYTTIASSGDCTQIVTDGYGVKVALSGKYGRIHTLSVDTNISINGDGAMITVNGADTVVNITGKGAVFRGMLGTVFIIYDGKVNILTVDGDVIKANKYYTFDGGNVVEWERIRNEE